MEEERKYFEDYILYVRYETTANEDCHRYTIKCVHKSKLVTVFEDSNVIDKTTYISLEDAADRVRTFYKQVFNVQILQK